MYPSTEPLYDVTTTRNVLAKQDVTEQIALNDFFTKHKIGNNVVLDHIPITTTKGNVRFALLIREWFANIEMSCRARG